MKNEHLDILTLAEMIIKKPSGYTTANLKELYKISDRTFRRWTAHLRGLGCDLVSVRSGSGSYTWQILNADKVLPQLTRWIELEKQNSLLAKTTDQQLETVIRDNEEYISRVEEIRTDILKVLNSSLSSKAKLTKVRHLVSVI